MDKNKWITMAEALLTQELYKQEEREYIRQHWHQNWLKRENTNYFNYWEDNKCYRHPKIEEFVMGFKFWTKSYHWSENREWIEMEVTEENYDRLTPLYRNDDYPDQYRINVNH